MHLRVRDESGEGIGNLTTISLYLIEASIEER